ncbi:hypothetical protein N7475_001165 [Penicillium sp. IBT 31633x]|nr:hypothetical protein N7475_001165 [Penicillium sp. IBT 31633x]
MSKPSPQQGGHSTPERAYIDLIPRTQHRAIHTPYPSQPRQILPQSTGYEHSTPTSLDPRPPALVPERNAEDPRYMLSSENPYMNLHPRPQVLPLRSHYQPPANHDGHDYYSPYDYSPYDYSPYDYSPYEERTIATLGQTTRDYDSHQIRTYDVESQ